MKGHGKTQRKFRFVSLRLVIVSDVFPSDLLCSVNTQLAIENRFVLIRNYQQSQWCNG